MSRKKEKIKKTETPQSESGVVDYSVYVMSGREKVLCILAAGCVLFGIGYIFYRSVPLSCLFALLALKYPRFRTAQVIRKRKQKLSLQFKDMIYSLSSAISAGNSVEHALELALEDMEVQYGDPNTYIVKELELITSRVSMNQNVEEVLADFGRRSGLEDIKTFAGMFEIAKRTSGNTIDIIRQTSAVITDKIEIENEMETMLSGKKMEQKVLTAIPILLVYFLTVTTGDFMAPIFTTVGGRCVATVAVVIIGIGFFWSVKLTDIAI